MKQKTKVGLLITSCFFVLLFLAIILIRHYEGAIHGISEGVFIFGVTLGMAYAYVLSRIDSHFTKRGEGEAL
ncbi:hypothetical protein J2T61_000015 [Methanocalculus sp. AMF5]|nr:hypothetical protein [Methanocalculus sp. AMF5]